MGLRVSWSKNEGAIECIFRGGKSPKAEFQLGDALPRKTEIAGFRNGRSRRTKRICEQKLRLKIIGLSDQLAGIRAYRKVLLLELHGCDEALQSRSEGVIGVHRLQQR